MAHVSLITCTNQRQIEMTLWTGLRLFIYIFFSIFLCKLSILNVYHITWTLFFLLTTQDLNSLLAFGESAIKFTQWHGKGQVLAAVAWSCDPNRVNEYGLRIQNAFRALRSEWMIRAAYASLRQWSWWPVVPNGGPLTREFSLGMTVIVFNAICQVFPVLSFFGVPGTISFPGCLVVECSREICCRWWIVLEVISVSSGLRI